MGENMADEHKKALKIITWLRKNNLGPSIDNVEKYFQEHMNIRTPTRDVLENITKIVELKDLRK